VKRLVALEAPDRPLAVVTELGKNFAIVGGDRVPATVRDFSPLDAMELARRQAEEGEEQVAAAGGGAGAFRAVAPPVMSFTQGRKR
jgi:hypothetical protein